MRVGIFIAVLAGFSNRVLQGWRRIVKWLRENMLQVSITAHLGYAQEQKHEQIEETSASVAALLFIPNSPGMLQPLINWKQ